MINRTFATLLMILAFSLPSMAQPVPGARTPNQLAAVRVYTTTDAPMKGRLLQLGPGTLSILTKGSASPQIIPLDSVGAIELAGDPLKNGIITGAVVLGGWCALVCGLELRGSDLLSAIAANALFGGLIGLAIDAGNSAHDLVYLNPKVPLYTPADALGRRVAVSAKVRW